MTTPKWTYADSRDASHAIRITGKPKFLVVIDEDFAYKDAKLYCDMNTEAHHRSLELSKENPLRRQAAYEEATMSDELRKLKQKEFIDRKQRQQLRNNCEELRELAEHLRLASITKDLDEHMAEMNKSKQLASHAKALGFKRAEAERQKQLEKEQEQELLKKQRQEKMHKILSTQIEETRRLRQQQCVNKMAEREERMAMQHKIEEEDRAEKLELERQKQQKLNEMIEFIEQQKELKQLKRAQSAENIAKVFDVQLEIEEQKSEIEAARQEAQRKHQEISLRIGQQVLEVENRKRQRDNLLLDLLQAEYKAKDDERFRQQLEQEQMERRRVRQELERYRAEVAERNLEQARLKQLQTLERKMECTDVKERDKELQERRQRKEHGALLLSMIEDNQRKRAEAAAENVQFFDMKAKSECELQERIQNERRQMLGSVPASVLQYLPKQVLSNSDREYFNIESKPAKATTSVRPKFL